jgi:SAM-dependent methyltransferase
MDKPLITPTEIRQRANELWVERGSQHGADLRDWNEAEEELRAERTNVRRGGDGSAYGYQHLFTIASRQVPYIPIIASWRRHDPGSSYKWHEVSIEYPPDLYELPPELAVNPLPENFQVMLDSGRPLESFNKCRLEKYASSNIGSGFPNRLSFLISRISYLDYLRSSDYLDKEVSFGNNARTTARERYMPAVPVCQDYSFSRLTNICGVGIFLISADNKVIVSEQSANISVYPGAYSYTASGTMDWNPPPPKLSDSRVRESADWALHTHPFSDASRETWEEVAHDVNPENIRLFGFGIDAQKLYFQFSFFEYTDRTAEDIVGHAVRHARDYRHEKRLLKAIDLDLPTLISLIKRKQWEPAAEVALISLCCRHFGFDAVEWAIDAAYVRQHVEKEMAAEWTRRAQRSSVMAVMSNQYPTELCPSASRAYVESFLSFLGREIDGARILEVGCGIGRLTARFVGRAASITCIDLSAGMIERCKSGLGAHGAGIRYHCGLAQDYPGDERFDIGICSLVLIHNVNDPMYYALLDRITSLADTVVVAEHVDGGRIPSKHTALRSVEQFVRDFEARGFLLQRKGDHLLFNDRVVFLNFTRQNARHREIEGAQTDPPPVQENRTDRGTVGGGSKKSPLEFRSGEFGYRGVWRELPGYPGHALRTLSEAFPHAVVLETLRSRVWSDRAVGDETIRQAIATARKALRQSLHEAGHVDGGDPIRTADRGSGLTAWRLYFP